DAPLTAGQQRRCEGCLQVPWALSATAIDYNLEGAPDHLRLSGPVIAAIYLGRITSWDDPAIGRLNPGVTLPSTPITVIFRRDGRKRPEPPGRQRDLDRRPTGVGRERLSDLDLHLRDRAAELAEGGDPEGLPDLRDRPGPAVRAEAAVRVAPAADPGPGRAD